MELITPAENYEHDHRLDRKQTTTTSNHKSDQKMPSAYSKTILAEMANESVVSESNSSIRSKGRAPEEMHVLERFQTKSIRS